MKFNLIALGALLLSRVACSGAEAIHSRYSEPYPVAASKKGLQVEMVDDALALGVKHAALNFNLTPLIDLANDTNNPAWAVDGYTFHFRRSQLESMDRRIKQLSDAGVIVDLIVLTYQSGDPARDRVMIHPGCVTNAPNHLGNFNTVTEEGRRAFTATMEFCAERWSRPDKKFGRVAGYIMGNEVNSHWWWANMGRVTMEVFADDYLRTMRLAHDAVRRESSWARVYISLEHHWNIRYAAGNERQAFAGRAFVDYFARRAREGGDFDWHIAFHPYPENLFEPRFWRDKTATNSFETPRITFKNLQVLPEYLRQASLLFEGEPRRIILSEQGFHTPKGTNGEILQAAAFCLAYKKVEALDGIDAFILHRHVDNAHEGGLMLGLRALTPNAGEARPRKKIYDCFRAADTPQWRETFQFALPVIGIESWPSSEL
ncbi:MAG: hypothetical protein QOF48_1124 [Verrucomicrobiota bacterium]|jgi:hypothetical protein